MGMYSLNRYGKNMVRRQGPAPVTVSTEEIQHMLEQEASQAQKLQACVRRKELVNKVCAGCEL